MLTTASPARARLGVSLMFFTNGVLLTALLPRYPEIKAAFGLSGTAFGLVVIAFPVGAIVAAGIGAPLVRRFGTRQVTAAGSIVVAAALAVAGALAEAGLSVWLFVAAMALAGLSDAVTDAAQNVQGIAVERWLDRSIINSLHALWSLGAATGGGIGAWAAAQEIDLGTQMAVNGSLWAVVAVVASVLAATPAQAPAAVTDEEETPAPVGVLRNPAARRLLVPLVLLAICGTLVEDVANNWVVLFLRTEADAAVALAGLGVSVVLVAQFVGRLLGDPMTDRWGRERVARAGGLLIAAGFVLSTAAPGPVVALVGFALAGLGCATLVPAAFAAADRVPGLPHGSGIAVLGWLMRIGFLVTSPVIGALSDQVGLRFALVVPVVAGVVAALVAHLALRQRERTLTASGVA